MENLSGNDKDQKIFKKEITIPGLEEKFFATELRIKDLDNLSMQEEKALREYVELRFNNYKDTGELDPDMTPEELKAEIREVFLNTLKQIKPYGQIAEVEEGKASYQYHESKTYVIKDPQDKIIAGISIDFYTKKDLDIEDEKEKLQLQANSYGLFVNKDYRRKNLPFELQKIIYKKAENLNLEKESGKYKPECVKINASVWRKNPIAMSSALKSGLLIVYDERRGEYAKNSGDRSYYARKLLRKPKKLEKGENPEYESRQIPLSNEDEIMKILKDGWEGYDVEVGKSTDGNEGFSLSKSFMFLRKVKDKK